MDGARVVHKWRETLPGDPPEGRPDDYERLKARVQAMMLHGLDRILPGISDHVVFAEVGTPLTNVHYVASTRGSLYGTEKSLWEIGEKMGAGQDRLYGADAIQRALAEVFVTVGIIISAWWSIELALAGEISLLIELPAVIAVSVIGR